MNEREKIADYLASRVDWANGDGNVLVTTAILESAVSLLRRDEPTPEALEAWAEWFDDPNKSPSMSISLVTTGGALPQATPGYLLREIARRLRAADPTGPR